MQSMLVIADLFKVLVHLLAGVYVILIIVAQIDCSAIPGVGSCGGPYQGGPPQHGLYWMGVILYSFIGVPAVLTSIFLIVRDFRR